MHERLNYFVCTNCRLSVEDIRLLATGSPRPWDSKAREKQKRDFQKTTYSLILKSICPDPVNRIRQKNVRWSENVGKYVGWGLPDNLSATANRIHCNLSLACIVWSHLGCVLLHSVQSSTVGAHITASREDMLQPISVYLVAVAAPATAYSTTADAMWCSRFSGAGFVWKYRPGRPCVSLCLTLPSSTTVC